MLIKDDTASCFRISIKYTPGSIYCLQHKDENIKNTFNNERSMELHFACYKRAKNNLHCIL